MVAKSFRGRVVLRNESAWLKGPKDLTDIENSIVRVLQDLGGIASGPDLERGFKTSQFNMNRHLRAMRKSNILVRNGALFLGPNAPTETTT